ncbi:MAG: ankyrin repeat domain-containing protein [Bacteroidales bacterium]|jgi:ankyrin repeat protein|nr:ankyrin repeat domain-containing protein [Bacteroidales bacterium]
MNKNYDTKSKFLKNIALGSFLLGSFAGTSSQLQADPIHSKSFRGDVIAVQQLLNSGVDPNKKNTSGEAPLHLASTPEVIDLLCNNGANPNITNPLGNTPLHLAIRAVRETDTQLRRQHLQELLSRMEQLLRRGANKDKPNNAGYSPASIVTQIIRTNRLSDGQVTLTINDSVRQAYLEVEKLFSQVRTKSLHNAVAEDDIAEVRRLLDAGADPNGIDKHGAMPLHYADNPEIIDLLCSKGANINGPNQKGDIPLHSAVSANYPNLEYIKQLLRKGADISIANRKGDTPLSMVQQAIKLGTVVNDYRPGTFISIEDDARLAYAEVLKLFFLPPSLW